MCEVNGIYRVVCQRNKLKQTKKKKKEKKNYDKSRIANCITVVLICSLGITNTYASLTTISTKEKIFQNQQSLCLYKY
jgi:hypothetical protein